MKIYLVNCVDLHEDGGVEYETETTVAVFTRQEWADALAARGGWKVCEMETDLEWRDSWTCFIRFDGTETACVGLTPVLALPESGPDSCLVGCQASSWTAEEARSTARMIYDRDVAAGYKKLVAEIEARRKKLGLPA